MKKHLAKLVALVIAATVALGAFTFTVAASERDTLITRVASEPVSMDPIGRNDTASSLATQHLFDTLVMQEMIDGVYTVLPRLATEWEFTDPQTVVFTLREGVYFHNGNPFSAEDVKYSLDRARASGEFGFLFDTISEVEVLDTYEVAVHLYFPFVPILSHLAHAGAGIVNMEHHMSLGEDDFERMAEHHLHPIGTGPFMFVENRAADRVIFERNPDWFLEVPENTFTYLDIRVIPDPTMALMALINEEIDVVAPIQPTDFEFAQTADNIVLIRDVNFSSNPFIGMNSQRPYLENPLVRRAINYAIDNQALIDVAMNGIGIPGSGPIGPMVWGHNPDIPAIPFDPDRAIELLEEAGYADGFTIELWHNVPNPVRATIAEMVQFMLRQVNIEVIVETMDWATYLSRLDEGVHDMYILGWVTVTGDADYGLHPLFHTDSFGATGNRTFTSDPELDELLELGRVETDPEARMEIYFRIQEIIYELTPKVFVLFGEEVWAIGEHVRGFEFQPSAVARYWNVYFEE